MKKKENLGKTVYYQNELEDEFSGIAARNFYIPSNYSYIHTNPFYRFFTFLSYRLILTPIAYLHNKIVLHQSFKNKKALKKCKKQGYFIYGNHTNQFGDGFTPSLMCFPKSVYLLVNPDNLSFKGFSTLFKMGGAMPLPSELKGMLPFLDAMEKRLKQGGVICIYPEAHIWPYCTWVRDFKNSSFKYPVKYDAPVYAFTNCYKKRLFGKKARMVTYIDGPFYPDKSLPAAERHIKLRDEVYEAMKKRAEKESDYSLIDYVKKEEIND